MGGGRGAQEIKKRTEGEKINGERWRLKEGREAEEGDEGEERKLGGDRKIGGECAE